MSLLQYACPHCARLFAVDPAWVGQIVSCPACGGAVTVPAIAVPIAPPEPSVPPESPQADPAPIILNVREQIAGSEPGARKLRRLSPEEKRRRRSRHSIIMLLACILVLFIALLWLRRG